ncbi:hypothetical protein GCM10010174_68430 [Kutzneria viridogrisea]
MPATAILGIFADHSSSANNTPASTTSVQRTYLPPATTIERAPSATHDSPQTIDPSRFDPPRLTPRTFDSSRYDPPLLTQR